jgi:uncharacterized protein YodC (DUF2158 family)
MSGHRGDSASTSRIPHASAAGSEGRSSRRAQFRRGDRVRYAGGGGLHAGPVGTVTGVSRDGVRVRWDDGRRELVHPDDIQAVTR